MVLGSLDELGRYINLHPKFHLVLNYLEDFQFKNPGERFYIDGESLMAIPALEQGKKKEIAFLEAHNRYIDIQICLGGVETMGWRDRKACIEPRGEFDPAKDIIFFNDVPSIYFKVPERYFAIFFPEDCHAPLIGDELIKKLIFKIEL